MTESPFGTVSTNIFISSRLNISRFLNETILKKIAKYMKSAYTPAHKL